MLEPTTGLILQPVGRVLRREPRLLDDEPLPRRIAWQLERRTRLRELETLLGWLYVRTTTLPRPGRGTLGPGYYRGGEHIIWTLWAPRENILIDIFRRRMPQPNDIADKERFVADHGLRYGIVEPGQILTADAIREWLNGEEAH